MHKVTIIPRGRALGVTMQLPEQDRYSMDRNHMLNIIAVLFGGRIAEEIFMNQMTTGASNDFERATELARNMVTRYGMSDLLGPMVYAENEGEVFLGRSITTHKNVSEETMRKVDAEIRKIIDQQYAVARKLIEDNRDKVEAMAKALLELETIDTDQIADIMAGLPPRPPKPPQSGAGPATPGTTIGPETRAVGEPRHKTSDGTRGARSGPVFCVKLIVRLAHYSNWIVPRVMGILNVTPDSFYDGGRHADPARALAHARQMAADGADLIDVGGESTRPGAPAVPEDEELRRVLPVVEALARENRIVSIDTRSPSVMRAALDAGATMINDVGALRAAGAIEAVAGDERRGLPHAHAGRAADDAGGPVLRRRGRRGSRVSRRARERVRSRGHRARPDRHRSRLWLRQDAGA